MIIDDEPIAREIIQTYCTHLPLLNVVASCGNALEAEVWPKINLRWFRSITASWVRKHANEILLVTFLQMVYFLLLAHDKV